MLALPPAVLFCCNLNEVRSPMAEGIMKRFYGNRIFVDSAGVEEGGYDPFMAEVMGEIGVDMSLHRPKTLRTLGTDSFELVIALSPQARIAVENLTRYMHCELRFWEIPDPARAEGSRAARLAAYRETRDLIQQRILEFFPREDF